MFSEGWHKNWSNIVTASCLILVGIVEAWQEAMTKLPATSRMPRLDGVWHYVPLALLIVAGVSWLVGRWQNRRKPEVGSAIQPTSVVPGIPTLSSLQGVKPNVTFNSQEWFKFAYYSPLTSEIETNIKTIARKESPSDPEAFYARFIGIGVVAYQHDMTWASIFKSQLLMLSDLNGRVNMTTSEVKKYYDDAVPKCSDFYSKYTFDRWLDYMKAESLLVVHPSQMAEISHRGRDFLKYIAHWGRDVNIKTC